jgi:hypothetical protein
MAQLAEGAALERRIAKDRPEWLIRQDRSCMTRCMTRAKAPWRQVEPFEAQSAR